MIHVLATLPLDGCALVENEGRTFLVRPPYDATTRIEIQRDSIEKAITAHGFQASNEQFNTWSELIKYLKGLLTSTARPEDREALDDVAIRLLHRAPESVLARYLERIEHELVPAKELEAATRMLTVLIGLEPVKASPLLMDRALRLTGVCAQMTEKYVRKYRELATPSATELARNHPLAAHQYGAQRLVEYVADVSSRGQLLRIEA
jgi:hypothetical protein